MCGLVRSRDKLKIYLPYHNACGHQTCHVGDIPWGGPTHRFAWRHFHMKIHLHTSRRPMETELGMVLTYRERLSLLKPHNPLIRWPVWGHDTIWVIYIFTFTRLKATKRGRVLTSGRRFSTQTLRSSPTSCLIKKLQVCLFRAFYFYFCNYLKP